MKSHLIPLSAPRNSTSSYLARLLHLVRLSRLRRASSSFLHLAARLLSNKTSQYRRNLPPLSRLSRRSINRASSELLVIFAVMRIHSNYNPDVLNLLDPVRALSTSGAISVRAATILLPLFLTPFSSPAAIFHPLFQSVLQKRFYIYRWIHVPKGSTSHKFCKYGECN